MGRGLNIDLIRDAAERYQLQLRYHALVRAEERGIYFDDIRRVILEGDVIERYEDAFPYPKCLFLGYVNDTTPLYVAVGYDDEHNLAHIVTVHWQDPSKWIDDRTRRPKPNP